MTITAILPANIVAPASRAARAWVVVRSLNHPDNGGTGSGLIKISLKDFCYWLRRSERSVWRYVSQAKAKGYFHRCDYQDGVFTIEYRGLRSLAKHLGLESIGAIGEFALSKVQHSKVFATDLELERLQGQSDFKRKEEHGKIASGQSSAYQLLSGESSSAQVPGGEILAKGKRLLYLSASWLPFGGSQQTAAKRLGVSVRTLQDRVSPAWREARGIPTINKAQTAQLAMENCPLPFFRQMLSVEDEPGRFVRLGRRVFKVGCNLYDSPAVTPRSQRFRKKEFWVEAGHTTKSKSRKSCSTSVITLDSSEFEEVAGTGKIPKTARL